MFFLCRICDAIFHTLHVGNQPWRAGKLIEHRYPVVTQSDWGQQGWSWPSLLPWMIHHLNFGYPKKGYVVYLCLSLNDVLRYCIFCIIRDNPHIVFAAVGARDTSQYGLSRQEDDGRAGKPTGKAGRTRSLGLVTNLNQGFNAHRRAKSIYYIYLEV